MAETDKEDTAMNPFERQKERDYDRHIGQRLREARVICGLSQGQLGDKLGLAFQQVQKMEKGINRIGAGRLYKLAAILDQPISFFYDGLSETPPRGHGIKRQHLEMIRHFEAIDSDEMRECVYNLIKAAAKAEAATTE